MIPGAKGSQPAIPQCSRALVARGQPWSSSRPWTYQECRRSHRQVSFDRTGDVATRPFRATNVGFGLSYILPVITAMLTPPGTLCLVENPEAHLHPRGQTRIAELAVRAAMTGVQIIVETHSDHFLDGVRIAVRDGLIAPEQIAIHYFERADNSVKVTSLRSTATGVCLTGQMDSLTSTKRISLDCWLPGPEQYARDGIESCQPCLTRRAYLP